MASSRSKAYAKRRRQAQKRRRKQQKNEQLQLETLEPKVLLAGNTSTEVTQILSVVPQPITRTVNPDGSSTLSQAKNQIDVYFNDVDLVDSSSSAENPLLYQLIFTNDTITNTDDGTPINPVAVNYNPSTNKAVLTFSNDLTAFDGDSGGPFRLRINTRRDLQSQPLEVDEATIYDDGTFDAAATLPTDAGSTFFANFSIDPESGEVLGPIGAASATGPNVAGDRLSGAVTIRGSIESKPYDLAFPGSDLEPGMREIPSQPHYLVDTNDLDGIASIPYNFQISYGEDPDGTPLRNAITENQKTRAREVFDIYGALFGVSFYETANEGFTIATGDLRAMPGAVADSEGGIKSVSGFLEPDGGRPTAILDLTEPWDDSFNGSWYKAAMREIGRLLGMGVTPEVSGSSVTGSLGESAVFAATHLTDLDGIDTLFDNQQFGILTERIFPGEASTVLGQHLFRPESQDIDVYRFQLSGPGRFSAETIAERLPDSSLLDSMLTLFDSTGEVIARNDDYFSEDSLIDLDLDSGTYFIAVTASGNTEIDPTIEDTGLNGTSEGDYTLRLDFRARSTESLLSRSGAALDGDGDGEAGGVFNFWFEANDASRTIYVDKAGGVDGGTLNGPVFTDIDTALNATGTRDIVRIIGNGGADGDITTLGDNLPYEFGFDDFQTLEDGNALIVPKDVTVMVDEGAIFKMRRSYVHVGSSTTSIDRSGAALQILGTPNAEVIFTSREDETIGVDSEALSTTPEPGEWGGIIFQNDLDRANFKLDENGEPRDFEGRGIFMNHVSNADLRYGGGNVTIDSIQQVVNPIHMIDARPTISYNDIMFSADAAISANPDSFEESRFSAVDSLEIDYQEIPFTSDYERVGPDIQGNFLANNTTNALSIRIETLPGDRLEQMTVSGRFDDTDIVHAVKENLIIGSTPGGPLQSLTDGTRIARTDGQLVIDPGIIVKLDGSRIEASVGAQLIAEGTEDRPVVLTSINDDRFAGITEQSTGAAPGDWSGIYVGHSARLSIDNAVIAYGGGISRVPGSLAAFNTIEIHQAQAARITNSVIENSAIGVGGIAEEQRVGRGTNEPGAIFVRGAQPIIVGNQITGTTGTEAGVINIDPNSLNGDILPDYGASRGQLDRFEEFDDNQGPLIRDNVVDNNSVNGMVVRPGVIATESVWDDTDIVHVLYEKIVVPNYFSDGGLRLESSPSESLVVKVDGNDAGFTTTGTPLDIPDRIGGILNVVGQPGKPVIITSLADDTVGAGLGLDGTAQTNTDQGHFTRPLPSATDSFQIDINFGPVIREHPDIMAGVERAARLWERLIEDPITVTIDFELDSPALPGDGTREPGTFQIPGDDTIGGGPVYISNPIEVEIPFDEVVSNVRSDARDHEAFVNGVPEFADIEIDFPRTLEDPFSLNENMLLTSANYKALFGDDSLAFIETASAFDPREATDGSVLINEGALGFGDWSTAPFFYDFDRSDGVQQNKYDFTGMMTNAIGRILGFRSSIEEVRQALDDPTDSRDIMITPMDLFRLEPGEGQSNFTAAPRALDPSQQSHVFYDGGIFDPADLPNELRLQQGDIPLLADEIGNDELNVEGPNIPTSYEHPTNLDGAYLGIGQVVHDVTEEYFITDQDRAVFDVIGYDIVGGPIAGDWRGIELETFTHDRNVAVITEFEDVNQEINAVPSEAQFVGAIAKDSLDADENQRAGIEIHGFINNPGDVDVYSFDAVPGTELWIDIDRTSQSLDTIVELVTGNGITLARSDNSHAEFLGLEERFESPIVPTFNLQKSPFLSIDHYTTNPKDAGLRVVIPGDSDELAPFFVRVRSAGTNPNIIGGGLTEGRYELQLRTQELDEVPGTSVQYADIRYAIDGVRATGLPRHSPLTGEVAEDNSANDTLEFEIFGASSDSFRTFGYIPVRPDNIYAGQAEQFAPFRYPVFENGFPQPQWVGNILTSDQGAIAISGKLEPIQDPTGQGLTQGLGQVDVDYYMFTVDFDAVQATGTIDAPATANLIFDVDYSDGLGRANTSISIYKASYFTDFRTQYDGYIGADQFGAIGAGVLNSGNGGLIDDLDLPDISSIPVFADILPPGDLVAFSEDGGDRDDLPGPVTDPSDPTNLQDLSRGSVGDLDPLLGPIALPQGSYILAVEPSNVRNNPVLDQFDEKLPLNPYLRAEPLSSLNRIVDQDFDFPVVPEPELPVLLDENGFVPLTLADVPLFVSEEGAVGTNIYTVDTFQGGMETHVGTLSYQLNAEGDPLVENDEYPEFLNVGDIALAERNINPNGVDILNVEERLFGFTLGTTDAESGRYLTISTADATVGCLLVDPEDIDQCADLDDNNGGALGDDLIQTYTLDPDAEVEEGEPRETIRVGDDGEGVQFEALALLQQDTRIYEGYAIGSRTDPAIDNVLYAFDHTSGNAISDPAPNRDDPPIAPEDEAQDEFFGFSDIVERGVLFTDRDLSAPWSTTADENADTSLVVSAATDVDGQPLIMDGQTIEMSDGTIYEFEIAGDYLVQVDPVNGAYFADGETFIINGVTYEIESGSVIAIDDLAQLQDGDVIAIADYRSDAPSLLIEIDNDDVISDGRVAMPLAGLADSAEAASRLADVINNQGSFSAVARAVGNRVSLVYDGGVLEAAQGITTVGSDGVSDLSIPIVIEEFYGSERIAATLADAIDGATISGNRIAFGALVEGLDGFSAAALQSIGAGVGVADGNVAIPITPDFTRLQVAEAIADAVGGDAFDGVVTVPQGGALTFAAADNMTIAGQSPGGQITGMTFVGNTMYAVSDRGGLFIINSYNQPNDVGAGAVADYQEQSAQLLGISFSGLTIGPQDVAGGTYANMLFATDSGGNLHAFDLDGVPQPIFADGATSIPTGVASPNGLQFSTAQTNLWQQTDQRGLDAGHSGLNSLRFGDTDRNIDFPGGTQGSIISNQIDLSAYTDGDRPALYFNYFMTAEESDLPFKRDAFRVFISDDSEDAAAKGTWHLLATSDEVGRNFDNDPEDDINVDVQTLWNNTYQDVPSLVRTGDGINLTDNDPDIYIPPNGERDTWPVQNREDDNPPPFPPDQAGFDNEPQDWIDFQGVGFPQLNETAGVWRQARVDLSDFAGSDALRLRFDFSTAASFDLGNFGGVELKAIAGEKLEDGDALTVDEVTFEVDFGLSIVTPAARSILPGETILLLDNNGEEFRLEFTTDDGLANNPDAISVAVRNFGSAEEVATAFSNAVNGLGTGMSASLIGNRITFSGVEAAFYEEGSRFVVEGSGLDSGVAEGNVPLVLDKTMTSNEVAEVLAAAFVEHLGEGIDANYVVVGNVIKMYGDTVSDQGPFGLATELRGDEWGSFITDVGVPAFRGQDNHFRYYELEEEFEIDERVLPHLPLPADADPEDFPLDFVAEYEGVYIDDLIIGFRTRGEDVADLREPHLFTGGWDEPSFNATPRIPNVFSYFPQAIEIDPLDPSLANGEYRLEIRVATQEDTFINQLDRTVPNVTLIAPSGGQVFDGKLFEITDGRRNIVFEYNDVALEDGVGMTDHVAINFSTDNTEGEMAAIIRDAINSLGDGFLITATTGDGAIEPGIVTTDSSRVNLFGEARVIEQAEPDGIVFVESAFEGSGNRNREQGQIIITQSRISESEGHGVIVEDALRDLPSYFWSDPTDSELHSQFNEGDYIPQPGPAQTLREVNQENLTTGVVVSNNVIAFNGEGGIKYGGDPNGYVFVAPFGADPPNNNLEVWDGLRFSVTDNNGETRTFEFHDLTVTNPGVPGADWDLGNVPILFDRDPDCIWNPVIPCQARYTPNFIDMADRVQEAFERSDLDVTVFRGKGHELFIEGAREMLWRPRDAPSWNTLFANVSKVTTGAVPFGRIVNNTIVGLGGQLTDTRSERVTPLATSGADEDYVRVFNDFQDVGIEVSDNADPTLLNNVLVNFEYGLTSDFTAIDIVRGGLVFQANEQETLNTRVGDFALLLDNNDPLFVDLQNGNFYPADSSVIIDSSIDSLEERPEIVTVKSPVGLAPSPILAPQRDVLGQLREDDPAVEPQNGVGRNAFKDRGAIDRVDFVGPQVFLLNPVDAIGTEVISEDDLDKTGTRVALSPLVELNNFEIQFEDSSQIGGTLDGTGVDPLSVSGVTVLQDGVALTEGVDYVLNFDATNSVLRVIPTVGTWPAGRTYRIELDGVQDLAGNAVRDNQIGGGVNFEITTLLGTDYGDAPSDYLSASHDIADGFFLGNVVTPDEGPQPDVAASADTGDDGVILPDEFRRNEANTITVRASADGVLDAWFDFNNNQVFDAAERTISGLAVAAGANEIDVMVPQATAGGELFARFRFTSAGIDSPSGLAADGEVEDYVIAVDGGAIWQNVLNPFDVDNDGFVSPRDVLQINQEMRRTLASDDVTRLLDDPFIAPNTPSSIGFVDVNGDGFVSPSDYLSVIGFINNANQGAGEPADDDAMVAAFASSLFTVDPIGEVLQNPVVELPRAVQPVAPELDVAFEDVDALVTEVELDAEEDSESDDVFADLDWLDENHRRWV